MIQGLKYDVKRGRQCETGQGSCIALYRSKFKTVELYGMSLVFWYLNLKAKDDCLKLEIYGTVENLLSVCC